MWWSSTEVTQGGGLGLSDVVDKEETGVRRFQKNSVTH